MITKRTITITTNYIKLALNCILVNVNMLTRGKTNALKRTDCFVGKG